jgi:monovalent cation/hydrogen antiporter
LIRWLGLEPDQIEAREEAEARLRTARVGLQRLDDIASGKRASDPVRNGTDLSDDVELRQAAEQLHGQYIHRVHYYRNMVHSGSEDGDTRTPDDRERDDREADTDARSSSAYQRLRLAMITAERQELVRLRDAGRISDGTLHRIELDLDLEQMLLAGQEEG